MRCEFEISYCSNPKPVIVDALEPKDDEDGLAERMLPRGNAVNKCAQ